MRFPAAVRLLVAGVAVALALGAASAGCASTPPSTEPVGPGEGDGSERTPRPWRPVGSTVPAGSPGESPSPAATPTPPGVRPGAFSWRDVRGGQDRIDAFRDLRDRTIAVLEEAARFPGPSGGAPSPAARELAAVRAAFDETRAPEELEARVVYFDRERNPPAERPELPAEGIEITLRRQPPRERARELVLTLEDLAVGGIVDGQLDRISLRWSPARLVIEIEQDGGQLVERVQVANEASYQVTSPHLGGLFARTQTEVYKVLSGNAFARAVREGSAPLKIRPSPPQGSSFLIAVPEAN